ncbi:MAG: hypothetical protein BWY70_00145 [Bacteroidetes bacterium ADurb.Bin408]|nr:MAG: hypothetical protein BWY70_00145 [Bacteroidetes bacterium ADurb.Bin408]
MKTSVEISMYPLSEEYEGLILDFISRLNKHNGITTITNGMSTQVFDTFDTVMAAITTEIKADFKKGKTMIFVMKCVNADLKNY